MGVVEELVRARETYERGDWVAAYGAFSDTPPEALTPADLDGLATSAYLLGRIDDCVDAWQQAFQLYADAGDLPAAVHCAWHLSMCLSTTGDPAGAGWARRAQRLLEEVGGDVVERGYVEFLLMFRYLGESDWATATEFAVRVVDYGRRFGDRDLLALGLSAVGRTRLQNGEVTEGLALFDEAMTVVTSGKISPIIAGNVYCVMIEGCQEVVGPRPRVGLDDEPEQVVQRAAGHARLHRPVRSAPRADHAAARRLPERDRGTRRRHPPLPGRTLR